MDTRLIASLLLVLGGLATVAWQLIWQHYTALTLGVSAHSTALILATLMAGIMAGALLAGRWLTKYPQTNPWVVYGILELIIGLGGQLFRSLQSPIEALDAFVFRTSEFAAPIFQILAIAISIGPAALAIGATTPVIGSIARICAVPVSRFYGANIAGAALGAISVAFWLIPAFGVAKTSLAFSAIQIAVFALCLVLSKMSSTNESVFAAYKKPNPPVSQPALFAFTTGACTFVLEIVWFRAIRSAWLSTIDGFAIILFAFLIALAAGAWLSSVFREKGFSLVLVMCISAALIIVVTPIIHAFDLIGLSQIRGAAKLFAWLLLALITIGPPVALLGTSLPWLLDCAQRPRDWARLYAWNTFGAVIGATAAAWLFLRCLSSMHVSWFAGTTLAVVAIWQLPKGKRILPVIAILCALMIAVLFTSDRIIGASPLLRRDHQVIRALHGPDVSTSVIEVDEGRALIIDGYAASGDFGAATSYMDSMGRIPMLLHENPQSALVICFGTGQTAHAVRSEKPSKIWTVDVNDAVYKLASEFGRNQEVLDDFRVQAIHMDGRAWLRRNEQEYDVITLEPMPPLFAGTNALYSIEFYELLASRLSENGIAAQWFPMHLLSPANARSAAAAFVEVFPNSILWIDPFNQQQGILVGAAGERDWNHWPGFERDSEWSRPISHDDYLRAIALYPAELQRYVAAAEPVTDDNLLLTHGQAKSLNVDGAATPAQITLREIFQLSSMR
ncbi:MAG: fused MFS/spermidine synthase [Verrucomicrobiota bacterium]